MAKYFEVRSTDPLSTSDDVCLSDKLNKCGIGTSSPAQKLHLANGDFLMRSDPTAPTRKIILQTNPSWPEESGEITYDRSGAADGNPNFLIENKYTNANAAITLKTNGSDRLMVDGNGSSGRIVAKSEVLFTKGPIVDARSHNSLKDALIAIGSTQTTLLIANEQVVDGGTLRTGIILFTAGPGTHTITDTQNRFTTAAGFAEYMYIYVTGANNNDGLYKVSSRTDSILTLDKTFNQLVQTEYTSNVIICTAVQPNVDLLFEQGGVIKVNEGKALGIYGSINAGMYQIFNDQNVYSGTNANWQGFFGAPRIEFCYPEWFGANKTPGCANLLPIAQAILFSNCELNNDYMIKSTESLNTVTLNYVKNRIIHISGKISSDLTYSESGTYIFTFENCKNIIISGTFSKENFKNENPLVYFAKFNYSNYVTIDNLYSVSGISFYECDNAKISNCRFDKTERWNLSLDHCDDAIIENVISKRKGANINGRFCNRLVISNSIVISQAAGTDEDNLGITADNSTDVRILNNVVYGNNCATMGYSFADTTNLLFEGNALYDICRVDGAIVTSGIGVELDRCAGTIMCRNNFFKNCSSGYSSAEGITGDLLISGDVFREPNTDSGTSINPSFVYIGSNSRYDLKNIVIENCQFIGGESSALLRMSSPQPPEDPSTIKNINISNITIDNQPMRFLIAENVICDNIIIENVYCHLEYPWNVINNHLYKNLVIRNCWFSAENKNTQNPAAFIYTKYHDNNIRLQNVYVQNWNYFINSDGGTYGATIFLEHVQLLGIENGYDFYNFNDWANVYLIDYRKGSDLISSNQPMKITAQSDQLQLQSYNQASKQWRIGTNIGSSGANRNLTIWETDLGNALTIKQDNGYVGIGVTNPGSKLEVNGDILSTATGAGFKNIINVAGTPTQKAFTVQNSAGNNPIGQICLNSSATDLLEILAGTGGSGSSAIAIKCSGGNVGIGQTAPLSKLEVAGSLGLKVVAKTATYTAGDEAVILVNATSGAVTINLPQASTVTGRTYYVKKTDSSGNAVSIDPYLSEQIDGTSTPRSITTQNACLQIISGGSAWYIIAAK